jgi:hypothetical protein
LIFARSDYLEWLIYDYLWWLLVVLIFNLNFNYYALYLANMSRHYAILDLDYYWISNLVWLFNALTRNGSF